MDARLNTRRRPALVLVFLIIGGVLATPVTAQLRVAKLSTPEELLAEINAVPCEDKERLSAAKALFEKNGAPASSITVQPFKDAENLVVLKPGATEEKIVIGAHYDKVEIGCGALDNWTGVVMLAHLYATLKDTALQKTLLFVAFGNEEKGLFGSRAMVKGISKEQSGAYCAMINLDSFGLSAPQVLDNVSSRKLREMAAEVAEEIKVPFLHASVQGVDADSSSFLGKDIPALTLHGLDNTWPEILHSPRDQAAKVKPVSLYLGYGLVLAMINRMDSTACDAYR